MGKLRRDARDCHLGTSVAVYYHSARPMCLTGHVVGSPAAVLKLHFGPPAFLQHEFRTFTIEENVA